MKTLKTLRLFLYLFMINTQVNAQEVTKKIVVEHFTNTRCSSCASRNPPFYSALNQKPNILHVAYHPSSPFSNCLFSTQNKAENDERTRFYGVFGGTPRFIVNGEEKSSSAMQNISVYTPFEGKTTPINLAIEILAAGADSIRVHVTITAVAPHNLTNLTLYVPLIEEVVNYAAPNGEGIHYDVFRKSFSGINPVSFPAPAHNGTPYDYTATLAKNTLWNLDRLYALAIVQQTDKSIVQTETSPLFDKNGVSSTDQKIINVKTFVVTPNPSNDVVFIKSDDLAAISEIQIYDIGGKSVLIPSIIHIESGIDISSLPQGTFLLRANRKDGKSMVTKFIKK